MKAFVVVALLVACVAGQQNMDFQRFNRDTSSLFKTVGNDRLVEDLLLKEKFGNKFLSTEMMTDYPTHWTKQQVSMMTLEEITSTQLFRTYYNIPLFRQFWEEHPVVFRKYVESVLFQQFWTVPAFMQYFMSPAMFYKYIVPQVQLFKTYSTQGELINGQNWFTNNKYSTQGELFKGQNWFSNDKYSTMDNLFSKPTYTSGRFDYGRMMNMKNMDYSVPSMINYQQGHDLPSIMTSTLGGELNQVNYKFLLDKIYSHLNQGGLTETLTQVRELPTGQIKEQTVAKLVDPITGQEKVTVGDIKMVDETIIPATLGYNNYPVVEKNMNTMVDSEILKEFLLKKYYLNKMFGGKKMMSNNYFPYTQKMNMFETTPEHLISNNKWINPIVARMYGIQGMEMNKNIESFSPIVKDDFMTKYQTEKMIKDFQTEKFIKEFQTRKMIQDEQEIIPEYHQFINMYNTIPKMDSTLTEEMKLQRIPLNYGKPIMGGSALSQFEKEMIIKNSLKY